MSEREIMMIVGAARQIRDHDIVFVGMKLPLLALALAQQSHAPHAVGLYEGGLARTSPPASPWKTMGDSPMLEGAAWAGSLTTLMGLLAQGHVTLGLLGAAQIDRYGNLNSSYIGPYVAPDRRLPGSGGASDIASLAHRTVVMLPHEPRRFVEEVDFITSPGHGTGAGWRSGVGLPPRSGEQEHGGPAAVVTDLGVLRFDESGEMVLTHLHPGVTVEEVQAQTGWDLVVSDALQESTPPTEQERSIVRALQQGREA